MDNLRASPSSESISHEDRGLISERLLKDSVRKSQTLCWLFSVVYTAYAFTSYDFIHHFAPDIGFFSNLWPRIAFNSLPALFLGLFLQRSNIPDTLKVVLFSVTFSMIFQIGAWIHVWPIALNGDPEILFYVNAANSFIITLLYIMVAPEGKMKIYFSIPILVLFIIPLFTVVSQSTNEALTKLIIGDTVFTFFSGIALSQLINRTRTKIAILEIMKEKEARKFLGTQVADAIYQGKRDLLKNRKESGFLLALDLRGYTDLVITVGEDNLSEFMQSIASDICSLVGRFGGIVHKTVGDGFLISFGLVESSHDISDLPLSEADVAGLETRRYRDWARAGVTVFKEFSKMVQENLLQYGLPQNVWVGGGLHFGTVMIRVIGDDSSRSELDIYGLDINKTQRLEAHTKVIKNQFPSYSSLLVLSPEAKGRADLDMKAVDTSSTQIRDFGDIKSVYVEEVIHGKVTTKQKMAA